MQNLNSTEEIYPVGFVRDTGRILNFRRSAGVQETTCILSKALLQIRRPSTVQYSTVDTSPYIYILVQNLYEYVTI
jgi:hypothetical protein